MAPEKKLPTVAIDLSGLPSGLQEAVGADLARSVVANVGRTKGPIIVGKLGPGIYGMIQPDLLGKDARDSLNAVLKIANVGK